MKLASRALLAVLLTIGFYVLAFSVAWGLFALAVFYVTHSPVINLQLVIGCVVVGALILVSIAPQSVPFNPPGPRLDLRTQPRLAASLQELARAGKDRLPQEIYMDLNTNASVFERGGLLGLGTTRVMILGLPLMQFLTISEMRAVLVHELGHYRGSDTKLSPWIYRTREALMLTHGRLKGLLRLPFRAYAVLYLRVTQAISRHQELAADLLAAQTVGARPLASGLRKQEAASVLFQTFWRSEVAPLLRLGVEPPIAMGYANFVHEPQRLSEVNGLIEERIANASASRYDSHPLTRDRLATLSALPAGPDVVDELAATSLLDDLPALEQSLLAGVKRPNTPSLRYVPWEDIGVQVLLPEWRAHLLRYGNLLGQATLFDLPESVANARSIGYRIPEGEQSQGASDRFQATGLLLLGQALGVALANSGWTADKVAGQPVRMVRYETVLAPFELVNQMAGDQAAAAQWRQRVTQLGVANVLLATGSPVSGSRHASQPDIPMSSEPGAPEAAAPPAGPMAPAPAPPTSYPSPPPVTRYPRPPG